MLRGFGARGLYADTVLAALQEWGLKDEDWRVRLHATLAVRLVAQMAVRIAGWDTVVRPPPSPKPNFGRSVLGCLDAKFCTD